MSSRSYITEIGLEGAIVVLSPLPLLFLLATPIAELQQWQLLAGALSSISCAACGCTLFRIVNLGKTLGITSAVTSFGAALPAICANPFVALAATVSLLSILFFLTDFRPSFTRAPSDHQSRAQQRARWGLLALPVPILVYLFLGHRNGIYHPYLTWLSLFIGVYLYFHWTIAARTLLRTAAALAVIGAAFFTALHLRPEYHAPLALIVNLLGVLTFPGNIEQKDHPERWWETLLNHPARIMLTTFLSLCVFGTFLLSLPIATSNRSIGLVDAAFTSVSAVCVTGLTVLDTPHDFTLFGQFCILLLIQLGGLGIMSIATVAINVMGRRLSLSHERLLTSMTDTHPRDLMTSLVLILKFTLITEAAGAFVLWLLFLAVGDGVGQAAWRAAFTAISAFCNAGFALQSDSLIPYQHDGLILQTISVLIIMGGVAPATCLLAPNWLRGRPTPVAPRIALTTTAIMLVAGTVLFLVFEWSGTLNDLSLLDKLQNAWFQSVTLRTAGFNSVDITSVGNPVLLVMILFMFIGGSPGGTAGGVKTTTITILALTFWANITNHTEIVTHNRRINSATIYRAITIIVSGVIFWIIVVLMLEETQQIPGRDLIFEATSALGTVGLTIGATPLLDEIGKIIIILAMFIGRIGPLTLFMILSNDRSLPTSRYPEENISLT